MTYKDYNSQVYRLEATASPFDPDDYKQYLWNRLKQDAGLKLYSLLEQQTNPIVVELKEEIIQHPKTDDWHDFKDKLRIELILTPVKYRHVEYQVTPSMLDYLRNYKPPRTLKSIWDNIKKRWNSIEL